MSDVWFEIDGVKRLDESKALARLLSASVLFANTRAYVCPFSEGIQPETIVLFANCNDVFAWGCADAEPIVGGDEPGDELYELYRLWEANRKWGPIKWVCLKRKEQPQDPIRDDMKKDGYWDAELEALPPNEYWTRLRERNAQRTGAPHD